MNLAIYASCSDSTVIEHDSLSISFLNNFMIRLAHGKNRSKFNFAAIVPLNRYSQLNYKNLIFDCGAGCVGPRQYKVVFEPIDLQ